MLKEISVVSRKLLSDIIAENTDLGYYQVQKVIKNRNVKINKERTGSDCLVDAGNTVYVYLKDREKDAIEILYKDDNILVVNKPSGVEVQGEDSLTTRVNDSLDDGVAVAVHRLDRNTMGLVIFAMNKNAERELVESFKSREMDKSYLAVTVGHPKQAAGTLKNFLFKDAKKSLVLVSDTPKQGYLPAESKYRLVKKMNELSLLEVKPITGRTHQIRVQLAHMGTPILGDGKYGVNGTNRKYRVTTQLLACVKINFHFSKGPLRYLDGKCVVSNIDLTQYYKKN